MHPRRAGRARDTANAPTPPPDGATANDRTGSRERTGRRSWPGEGMPEDGTPQIVFLLLEEDAERFRAVGGFEAHPILGRESPRAFTFGGRVPVARSERVHDLHPNARARYSLDARPFEQRGSPTRQAQRAPAIRRDPRCHAHGEQPRRPAERSDAERDARSRSAGAEWYDDGVGWRVELRTELKRRQKMPEHRAGVGATARNPVWRPFGNTTRTEPGAEHGPWERHDAGSARDQVRFRHDRRADCARRFRRRRSEEHT